MTRWRLAATGGLVAVTALALDALLLRSFEFLTWPSWPAPYGPGEELVRSWSGGYEKTRPEGRCTDGVTLVIVDGLRVDALAEMPALRSIGKMGGVSVLRAEFPTFSRVGYATMLTGAPPRMHGFLSNNNHRPSPIDSVADVARREGIRTRLLTAGHSWIPQMFPRAFDEVASLGVYEPSSHPYLDIIYLPEPDGTAHRFGGASAEYRAKVREVDGAIAGIASTIDLSRETIIVTSDHGHLDRGGHGGSEEVVVQVPLVEAGPGAVPGYDRLESVAAEIARLLGLPAHPRPPPEGAPFAPIGAGAAGLCGVGLALRSLLRGRGRDFAAAALGACVFAGLYAARGHPYSFSCVNDATETPRFALEVFALGLAGIFAGLAAAGFRRSYFAAALALAVASAAAAEAVAGPTAATALDHPRAAYLYDLALGFCVAAGAASLLAALAPFSRVAASADR
jgi:hypothetical protein